MNTRLTLSAVAAATALFFVAPEAHAQAKSNITDDPNSSSCTQECADAGYTWAEANTPTEDSECAAAANADFAAGCAHWLEEQREAAAPPPEDPDAQAAAAEADAAADQANQAAEQAADQAADAADQAADAADAADAAADAADAADAAQSDDNPPPPPTNQ
jgi:hypothetical protein